MLFDWQLHPGRQRLSLERRSRTGLRIFLERRREFSCSPLRRCIGLISDASTAPSSPCFLFLLLLCLASLSLTPPIHRGRQQIHPIRPLHAHLHNHHRLDRRCSFPLVLDRLVHRHSHHRYCYQTGTYHMLVLRRIHRHLEPFWEPACLVAAINFGPALS